VLSALALIASSSSHNFMRMNKQEREKFIGQADAWHYDYSAILKKNPDFVPSYRTSTLPTSFDGRKAWPTCIHPILDQGDCESCWSFAASETLSDRFCVFSNGTVNEVLSPQSLLSCEWESWYCAMGSPPNFAWEHLQNYGIVTMGCFPYQSGRGSVPSCPSGSHFCEDGESVKYYKAQDYEHVGSSEDPSSHVQEIMAAVMQGPVDVTFDVWSDFDGYTGGVYKAGDASYEGLHSVKIIGWGVDPNQGDYWIVANSWGTSWGPYGGFFLIARGVDECLIESMVYAGTPDLSSL